MNIHWDALLSVFLVSLGSAVAVVVLVGSALVGLSARAVVAEGSDNPVPPRRARTAGTAAACACLVLAAAIVLAGLWVVVAG